MVNFMMKAIQEAKKAYSAGEVPVGAVVVLDNRIIARGHNMKESMQDPTAHAEIIAIREASKKLKTWRLNECILLSTIEPCIMCCGAIIQARIKKVIYAVEDKKFGGIESIARTFEIPGINHHPEVEKLYIKEARDIMVNFFRRIRRGAGVWLNGPDSKSGVR